MFSSIYSHRHLLLLLTRRDVAARYRGSMLGAVWVVGGPLLMLGVYTFVFSVVFKARWPGIQTSNPSDFAVVLFSGLILFTFFSECIVRSTSLIREHVNYVKKVVFPLEVLPAMACASAGFTMLVSFGVLAIFYLATLGVPPSTVLLLPVPLLLLAALGLGIALFLSSLGVFLPDLRQVVAPVTSMLMFFSPVFYPATALPEAVRPFLYLNPTTPILEISKQILFRGELPSLFDLGLSVMFAAGALTAGAWWFNRTKKAFADVI